MSEAAEEIRPLMALSRVTKTFGALTALDALSLEIGEDEILGIAGPNGAGKSTLLGVCTGLLKVTHGTIRLDGERVDGLPAHRLCARGVARTFQTPTVFASLSVRENVETAAMFGGATRGADAGTVDQALGLAGLGGAADRPVAGADLMTRKMTMLAAALATRPRILFMDEPLAGLNPEEVDAFAARIAALRQTLALTVVVVEHKVRALRSISDRILILNFGTALRLGAPDEVMRAPEVVEIYLGGAADA